MNYGVVIDTPGIVVTTTTFTFARSYLEWVSVLLFLAAMLTFQPVDAGLPQTGMWRHGFAVADMNGDGRPDLVFTSPRKDPGPPRIFLNQGGLRFVRWEEVAFPSLRFDYGAVSAADFDGDGATDLAVGVHYGGVIVLLGDGQGRFSAVSDGFTFPSPFSSRALTVTDWNSDGRLDVAALSDGPRPGSAVHLGVTVFENLGSSWKTTRATVSDATFGDSIAAGDIDGDGLSDLVTASHRNGDAHVVRVGSDGDLTARAINTTSAPGIVSAVEVADFDRDGRDEIVVGYSSLTTGVVSLELLSFPSGSRPVQRLWSEGGAGVIAIATGDLNGDGARDIVAALLDGRILTFAGNGQGSVERAGDIEPSPWRTGCAASGLRVADLDADSRSEIIATFADENCRSGGGIEVFRTSSEPSNRRRSTRR